MLSVSRGAREFADFGITACAGEYMAAVYLGLGTNLGDRETNLREALRRLDRIVSIDAVSTVYLSAPVGYREQPDFWNVVIRARTTQTPIDLLHAVKRIEKEMGRRASFRNAPRPIDIDIVLYDKVRRVGPELVLPHPRMLERAFVLRPLLELDPEARDPRTGQLLRQHLSSERLEPVEPLFPGSQLLPDSSGPQELDRDDA